jgi:hypothetical protein
VVLVCGSREWTDRETIRAWLRKLPRGVEIVHGDNGVVDRKTGRVTRGADKISGEVARELGFVVRAHPADWKAHGKAAGPLRNQAMLDTERPARVVAFTSTLVRGDGPASRPTGTADCVMRALAMGIPCTIVPSAAPR